LAEAHVGELPPGTKACVVCGEPINIVASRCIHCQSEQGWIRRVGVSTTVLSLAVALVSVLAVAVPALKETLTTKNSHLVFSIQGASAGTVYVLVSNQGIRPGSVAGVAEVCTSENRCAWAKRPLNEITLLGPGQSALLEFYPDGANPHMTKKDKSSSCEVGGLTTDFVGRTTLWTVPIECMLTDHIVPASVPNDRP
jgi:hypothetical protein